MSKNLKLNFMLVSFFIVMPSVMFAQDIDPPPPYEDIDPPPAPIDNSIVILVIAGVLFVAYYFYKSNIKMQKK